MNSFAQPTEKKASLASASSGSDSTKVASPAPPFQRPADEIEDAEIDDDCAISRWDSVDTAMLEYPCSAHIKHTSTLSPHPVQDEETTFFRSATRTTFHPDVSLPTSPLDPTYTHPSRRTRGSFSSFSPSISQFHNPDASSNSNHHKMDKIRWQYTKTALLFTISILITWIPASINRVQGLTHPHQPNYYMLSLIHI